LARDWLFKHLFRLLMILDSLRVWKLLFCFRLFFIFYSGAIYLTIIKSITSFDNFSKYHQMINLINWFCQLIWITSEGLFRCPFTRLHEEGTVGSKVFPFFLDLTSKRKKKIWWGLVFIDKYIASFRLYWLWSCFYCLIVYIVQKQGLILKWTELGSIRFMMH